MIILNRYSLDIYSSKKKNNFDIFYIDQVFSSLDKFSYFSIHRLLIFYTF